jgi:hypothetical protein
VVSLSVPTELRGLLRNAMNKPLTRLERSTGEKDEARARRAYMEVRKELERELEDRALKAGANFSREERVKKAGGQLYKKLKAPRALLLSIAKLRLVLAHPQKLEQKNVTAHRSGPKKLRRQEKLLAGITNRFSSQKIYATNG